MSVSAKGKQQKKLVSTTTVSGTVDRAYLILPFGDCRVHIFLTTFLEIAVYIYWLIQTGQLFCPILLAPAKRSYGGEPFATRDSSQASPVGRDSSLQFGVIRRESEAPENSQTLLPIKVLSRGDNGIFGIVKALKYSYFVFFLFQQMGFLGRFCKFCRFCGSPICLATQCNYPETQYVTACSLEPRSILVYVLKFGSSAR